MTSLKVSVIIPMYNSEKYLSECLDSVRASTYTDLEVILADDGSTDSTRKIAEEYCIKDDRFRLLALPHGGVSRTRNTAIANAEGEYILFVDSDDLIHARMVEHLVDCVLNDGMECCIEWNRRFEENVDIGKMSSEIITVGSSLKAYTKEDSANLYFKRVSQFGRIGGFFVKKTLAARGFRTDLFTGEDSVFTYECIVSSERTMLLNEELYFYRQHDGNVIKRFDYEAVSNKNASFDVIIRSEESAGRKKNADNIREIISTSMFNCYVRARESGDRETARKIRHSAYCEWFDKQKNLRRKLKLKFFIGFWLYPMYFLFRKLHKNGGVHLF